MNSPLFHILACPKCHGALEQKDTTALVCNACRLAFPIEGGLPILLIEKAHTYKPQPSSSS